MALSNHLLQRIEDRAPAEEHVRTRPNGACIMKRVIQAVIILSIMTLFVHAGEGQNALTYRIVDTSVVEFYDNSSIIQRPAKGDQFFGQDAQYLFNKPSYTDNGDGTVTDTITGLMWQKTMGPKLSFEDAFRHAKTSNVGGYRDWRVPTIKELYSLIQFSGRARGQESVKLFIDTHFFQQPIGNPGLGEREIDAQTWSATEYVGRTMRNDETVFGVNFVDGRIKGYPKYHPRTRQPNKMYFRLVRGNTRYGLNQFIDNKDGTVTDTATGLMWQKSDSGRGMDWQAALNYAEGLELAMHDDWRLPNAKELQSLVDYSRSVKTTASAAINPIFQTTEIRDPEGRKQYPYFWTSTTHLDGRNPYSSAVYIAFGEAQGRMHNRLMDVHGAGAQRSDPKTGNARDYPQYFGPQGDLRYVFNFVRCVRNVYP